jgi:hypothetical protein
MKFLLIMGLAIGAGWYYLRPNPPGTGPEAQAAERAGQTYLDAIERYHAERGGYPLSLDDLVPDYLASRTHRSNGTEPEYQRLGASYKLTVNYTNPLPVHCAWQPGTRWVCEWF